MKKFILNSIIPIIINIDLLKLMLLKKMKQK